MTPQELSVRTKSFAIAIISLSKRFPRSIEADVIRKQLVRSGTSVGANYRACGRSRSDAEFHSKLSITLEEADETLYWLEIAEESGMLAADEVRLLKDEALQLVKIFVTARNSIKSKIKNRTS